MARNLTKTLRISAVTIGIGIAGLLAKTYADVTPVQSSLRSIISDTQDTQITDRNGYPLTITYQQRWNVYDALPLHRIPNFLKQSFILSEDKQFYQHHGVDWRARGNAVWQNIRSLQYVRGASTITEQVIRMITPRPRTLWSKWIEGWEAMLLERRFAKADILEFYLNQLPYASHRRGIVQAARYYFNRDLSTLSHKEMLALVMLARAPSSLDLYRHPERIEGGIVRLAEALAQQQLLTPKEQAQIAKEQLTVELPSPSVNAAHFVHYLRKTLLPALPSGHRSLRTTLDHTLQQRLQHILDERVKSLNSKSLHNAAALVVDHTTGEVLAWVIAGAESGDTAHPVPGYQIDTVTTPRQPGSALKAFLYTLALEKGWTPATLIDDSPLTGAVGSGLHRFKNYSNIYYGSISLREALANSLNIPAIRTINYVGTERYLQTLHKLGFASLNREVTVYDEGLALGNGEVTLLELVQGYAALANRGIFRPLSLVMDNDNTRPSERVFSEEATSLIANILSDPWARRLEFGRNSVLNLPVQTAVKTGTSTDYRDAWAVGFNYRYVVGIWMGNLDQTPTDGVTGSTGPALALRSIFSELTQYQKSRPLYLSPRLVKQDICITVNTSPCITRTEYFIQGTEPDNNSTTPPLQTLQITQPTHGLSIAIDPRIPRDKQQLEFRLEGVSPTDHVEWILNGISLGEQTEVRYLWPLTSGKYTLQAIITHPGSTRQETGKVRFTVK